MERAPTFLETLREQLQAVEPAALLVEPRILRRVIRLDRRLQGFGFAVPHHKSYTIERERLLAFVELAELELSPSADLTRVVILLSKPDDEETQQPAPERLSHYERLLFHARVHLQLEKHSADTAADAWAAQRRRQLGEAEFAEMRSVLAKDDFLFPSADDLEVYIEFAAVYLELRYFAPHELPLYFPAVRDWETVDAIVSQDIDHAALYERSRLSDAAPLVAEEQDADEDEELELVRPTPRQRAVTLAEFRRAQARAERAAAVGNGIKAAISHMQASRVAPAGYAAEARAAARSEIARFVARLRPVLELTDEETTAWCAALEPLLAPAAEGFWSNEARLLYDLQKVCVERERGVYRLDLIEWLRTRGKRPIRRPLPILRDALILRHLRTAARRAAVAQVPAHEREQLTQVLNAVLPLLEHRSRDRLRPILVAALDEVGLLPNNVPEQVARRKVVEELLDRIVERSYLSMADLRDALSKNDLKLPDVSSLTELWNGDRLLRADRKLDQSLDGIYRRGAFYLRWSQRLSSLAFGTNFGRFLTKYIAVPFGGAYLSLAFVHHVIELLQGKPTEAHELLEHGVVPPPDAPPPTVPHFDWLFYVGVLVIGTWISLLLHRPTFRAWNIAVVRETFRALRWMLFELPSVVLHSEIVQRVLNSYAYTTLHNYVLRPGIVTGCLWLGYWAVWRERLETRTTFEVYLVVALFLTSSVGRYVTEVSTDFLVRAWHELRIRVVAAVVQWIMDLFHGLLVALERVLYQVDEWLRFRAGDNRAMQSVKAIGGVLWFFVSYVVVFVFTLLLEPQINPIKHFPVVTVAHKIILPLGVPAVRYLEQFIGKAEANTLVWTTIWLIPGVFGFLVWELKENWRLYAANRARALRPVIIGHHGETMVRLLRPGFHSGTLNKAFAALRRAARKAEQTHDPKLVRRKLTAIQRAQDEVAHFVERELVYLLEEAHVASTSPLAVKRVTAATHRVDVEIERTGEPHPLVLTWQDDGSVLRGQVTRAGWLLDLPEEERATFAIALTGLFQRSGVDEALGPLPITATPPIEWQEWVKMWTEKARKPSQTLGIYRPAV